MYSLLRDSPLLRNICIMCTNNSFHFSFKSLNGYGSEFYLKFYLCSNHAILFLNVMRYIITVDVCFLLEQLQLTKATTVQATGVASNLVEAIQGVGFKLQTLSLSFEDFDKEDAAAVSGEGADVQASE
ncbi:unnamed protein product [Triticum turgidum subsp. durum]|uniref:Uncharacterized protein n=1 Tax=Triticum turgidum subsp. durum TaxID=4567 RepID=A0A9R0QZ00_TRITD|nr:unnamed protein product [Triticum turgidum subsp. durum]